ncbi:MAG: HlyC/CorC family transporter [Bacteroidetes bacterium]|nr:MAG: HlyC/CorC family transporter [Bacteroidota bacterium]REK07570.1 MAG: HlyC/CorC family transporter [Bacteroidota bacterium]REK47818.1 MAG: HlyC/CorC family transporter [Bacteroidota bacterium]
MEILIIILLTLVNGFLALSEIAFVSVRKSTLENMAAQGNTRAKTVLELLKNPESFLSSVQVGITLIGIISGAYGGITLTGELEQVLSRVSWMAEYARELALLTVVGGITYFSIVIGELVPKSIAIGNANSIALFVVPVINYFTFIAYPFVKLLSISTSVITKILGVRKKNKDSINEEELIYLLKAASKQGVLHKEEGEAHQNLFYFSDQVAKSLMTPAARIEWIDINEPNDQILEKIRNSYHSRFPVCEDSLDKIRGVLSIKDFLENYQEENFHVQSIMSEPIFLSQYTSAFNIISQFKLRKDYIGFVVDEYGSVKGMITLRDLTEAIIGDLPEISEDGGEELVRREDGSYLVNGQLSIFDLNQYFKKEVIRSNPAQYITIAGYVSFKLGKLPQTGDHFENEKLRVEVIDMDGKRVDKLLIFLK